MRCSAAELAAIERAAGDGHGARSRLLRDAVNEYLTARGLPTEIVEDEMQLALDVAS